MRGIVGHFLKDTIPSSRREGGGAFSRRKSACRGANADFDQAQSKSPDPLVPAQAGTQGDKLKSLSKRLLDSRLRGNEQIKLAGVALLAACLFACAALAQQTPFVPDEWKFGKRQ